MQITAIQINLIINEFLKFFNDLGYEEVKPDSIIQEQDKTLTFTNSTIVPLKKRLLEGIKEKGFVILQPCLRMKNLKRMKFDSPFTSYFRMVGILTSPEISITNQAKNIFNYLTEILSINPNEITIHHDDQTTNIAMFFSKYYEVKINAFVAKYYNWKYGIEDVFGKGITFYVTRNQISRELGNFIEIRKGSKIIGYEFGLGVETCHGILNGVSNNFITLFNSNENKKIYDCFIALCIIIQELGLEKKKNVYVSASVRKLRVELKYEIFKTQFRIEKIENLDGVIFNLTRDTIKKVVEQVINEVKLLDVREKKLIDYIDYLSEQIKKQKPKKWGVEKFNEYILKNNLKRVLQISTNEKLINPYKYFNV